LQHWLLTGVVIEAPARSRRSFGRRDADCGRGIEAEHLSKIFEPFFTTRTDGTGLGLAIVSKLVRAHGGEVGVRSEIGRGATFTVTLPTTA
jgi:signal transduction histidine kinase